MSSGKAVLISIKPRWCVKIFGGKKNLEFRKTVPKIELPFTCYVYCTQKQEKLLGIIRDGDDMYGTEYHGSHIYATGPRSDEDSRAWANGWCKNVIGEMTVDRIEEITVRFDEGEAPVAYYGEDRFRDLPEGYLVSGGFTYGDFVKYKGNGKVYGWHISGCKLYKKPKKIGDFRFYGKDAPLKYPPQSYAMVNDLKTLYPSGDGQNNS